MEELEAIDFYDQRAEAIADRDLAVILVQKERRGRARRVFE